MASKTVMITTIARANSLSFSTMFNEINQLLKAAGKLEKSSQAFGIAIEAYCQKMKGNANAFKRTHRKNVKTWDIDQLLAIKPSRVAENVRIHNEILATMKAAKSLSK